MLQSADFFLRIENQFFTDTQDFLGRKSFAAIQSKLIMIKHQILKFRCSSTLTEP